MTVYVRIIYKERGKEVEQCTGRSQKKWKDGVNRKE